MRKGLFLLTIIAFGALACTLTAGFGGPGLGMASAEAPAEALAVVSGASVALEAPPTLPVASTPPPEQALVMAQAVNLRACPGLECVILDTLTGGQLVIVISTQFASDGGNWSNVITQAGESGWINSRYLEMQP